MALSFLTIIGGILALAALAVYFVGIPPQVKRSVQDTVRQYANEAREKAGSSGQSTGSTGVTGGVKGKLYTPLYSILSCNRTGLNTPQTLSIQSPPPTIRAFTILRPSSAKLPRGHLTALTGVTRTLEARPAPSRAMRAKGSREFLAFLAEATPTWVVIESLLGATQTWDTEEILRYRSRGADSSVNIWSSEPHSRTIGTAFVLPLKQKRLSAKAWDEYRNCAGGVLSLPSVQHTVASTIVYMNNRPIHPVMLFLSYPFRRSIPSCIFVPCLSKSVMLVRSSLVKAPRASTSILI